MVTAEPARCYAQGAQRLAGAPPPRSAVRHALRALCMGECRYTRAGEAPMQFRLLAGVSMLAVLGCDPKTAGPEPGTAAGTVVLYCSLDEPFSRFIKEDFLAKTGITVKFLTDEEVDKSVGLRTRLVSERNNPQCDVFWNNEPGNTEVLRQQGLLAPYKSPAAAGIPERF